MQTHLKISTAALLAAIMFTSAGNAASVTAGVNLGGSNQAPTADVNIDGGNGGGGSGSGSDVNATVDLGTNGGSNGTLLDLNGDPVTADFSAGDTDADVLVDLFGSDGGSDASVVVGSGGTGAIADLNISGTDAGADVLVDLFGPGSSDGGAGGDGIGGTGDANGRDATGSGTLVASIGTAAAGGCFTPSAKQLDTLSARHDYWSMSGWGRVSGIKIVELGVCADAQDDIGADGNIAELQSKIATSPKLRAALQSQGHSAADVIAVDKNDGTLGCLCDLGADLPAGHVRRGFRSAPFSLRAVGEAGHLR